MAPWRGALSTITGQAVYAGPAGTALRRAGAPSEATPPQRNAFDPYAHAPTPAAPEARKI
jgi:hypothetical protein